MKKLISCLLCLSAVAWTGVACADIKSGDSSTVLVCRARQCADTSYAMTKGFLFNKITQMMKNNNGKIVLLCEADPVSHVCLKEGIAIPAETVFARTDIVVDSLRLVDEKLVSGTTDLDLVFDYKIRANDTYPACQLSMARLSVDYVDKVEMTAQDTVCNITETGRTSINATYNIDYLDFDYGFIGAYYTIGIGEGVQGDKTGYVLMRFTHEAPLTTEPETEQPSSPRFAEAIAAQQSTMNEAGPAILRQTTPQSSLEQILSGTTGTAPAAPTTSPAPVAKPTNQRTEVLLQPVEVIVTMVPNDKSGTPEVKVVPKSEPAPEVVVAPEEVPTPEVVVVPHVVPPPMPAPKPAPRKVVVPAPEMIPETSTKVFVQQAEATPPTVIKTTIVEKTVITPDGTRQVTPPEKRTYINGELQ